MQGYEEAMKTPLKSHIDCYMQDMTLMFQPPGKGQSHIVFNKSSVVVNIYTLVAFFLSTFCERPETYLFVALLVISTCFEVFQKLTQSP